MLPYSGRVEEALGADHSQHSDVAKSLAQQLSPPTSALPASGASVFRALSCSLDCFIGRSPLSHSACSCMSREIHIIFTSLPGSD